MKDSILAISLETAVNKGGRGDHQVYGVCDFLLAFFLLAFLLDCVPLEY
jgi:hypothetical protein